MDHPNAPGLRLTAWALLLTASLLLASCGSAATPQPDPNAQIQAAVAATLASIPTATPYPLPTAYPTPTPVPLDGLFCEYGFCIGHSSEIYLADASSVHNPASPSTYDYGILFGFSPTLFVQIVWTTSGSNFDPQTTMKYILQGPEKAAGNMDTQAIGDLTVYYEPINTVSDTLQYGGAAAWQCGGRDFAWKVYTPQDGMAPSLLQQALEQFRCDSK